MIKNCGCPYGCCSCHPVNDDKTDVFYNPTADDFLFLVEGASSMSPVGWEVFDKLIYLGKLGDSYLEHVGRSLLHSEEVLEFKRKNGRGSN